MRDHFAITKRLPCVDALALVRLVRLRFWETFLLELVEGHDFAALACTHRPFFWLGQSDGAFRLSGCRNHGK